MERIIAYATNIRLADVIDIMVVAVIIYKLMMLIRETRAEQLIKGIIALLLMAAVTNWLNLYTMKWIINTTLVYGMLSLLIVFQPELRRALEYIGRSNFLTKPLVEIKGEKVDKITEEVIAAVASLARQKIGALIVIERSTGLNEILESGTKLDADISSELLVNIFIPNTPLHDGAVILRGDKIRAAGCFLPLTENQSLSKELGTRHRAALGVSERSDAMALVVSEETGAISIAESGKINRYIDDETLRIILQGVFATDDTGLFSLWRGRDAKDTERP
ncbi:MAG: diadenylate cyclase CdaA [Tissierellia bacterium]|nr:diadenylate cyclase CdaA [Tissierellia bacterium]